MVLYSYPDGYLAPPPDPVELGTNLGISTHLAPTHVPKVSYVGPALRGGVTCNSQQQAGDGDGDGEREVKQALFQLDECCVACRGRGVLLEVGRLRTSP